MTLRKHRRESGVLRIIKIQNFLKMKNILSAIQEWHENEDDLQASYQNLSHYLQENDFPHTEVCDVIARLSDALRTITKGEGRYSRDPLTHADNTIADLIAVAESALSIS